MNCLALSSLVACVFMGSVSAIQLPASCGKSTLNEHGSSWRIVGGKIAKAGEWPWQVYLNKSITYDGIQMLSDCGGAILSKDWILTGKWHNL